MREKANAALLAGNEATLQPQLGMGLHDRVQRSLILTDKRLSAVVLAPVVAKRENFLDRYDKKARLSVIMLSVLCTPSSYLLDAKASRGRARSFCCLPTKPLTALRHNRCNTHLPRSHCRLPTHASFPGPKPERGYLKEGTSPSSFQVVGQFT
jgi:hypothetical protein